MQYTQTRDGVVVDGARHAGLSALVLHVMQYTQTRYGVVVDGARHAGLRKRVGLPLCHLIAESRAGRTLGHNTYE
jgi:hypothetical protein